MVYSCFVKLKHLSTNSFQGHTISDLPSGTITFLFTNVQDSTHLWETHLDATQRALKRHDEIIEWIAREQSGAIVRPQDEGDSHFIVFECALDGIKAGAAIQQAFQEEPWLEGISMFMRMGVHTGGGEFRDGDHYGARLSTATRG